MPSAPSTKVADWRHAYDSIAPIDDRCGAPQLSLWPTGPADGVWRVRISERARHLSIRVHTGGQVESSYRDGLGGGRLNNSCTAIGAGSSARWRVERSRTELARTRLPGSIELAATGERWVVQMRVASGAARLNDDGVRTPSSLSGDGSSVDEQQRMLRSWLIERSAGGSGPVARSGSSAADRIWASNVRRFAVNDRAGAAARYVAP